MSAEIFVKERQKQFNLLFGLLFAFCLIYFQHVSHAQETEDNVPFSVGINELGCNSENCEEYEVSLFLEGMTQIETLKYRVYKLKDSLNSEAIAEEIIVEESAVENFPLKFSSDNFVSDDIYAIEIYGLNADESDALNSQDQRIFTRYQFLHKPAKRIDTSLTVEPTPNPLVESTEPVLPPSVNQLDVLSENIMNNLAYIAGVPLLLLAIGAGYFGFQHWQKNASKSPFPPKPPNLQTNPMWQPPVGEEIPLFDDFGAAELPTPSRLPPHDPRRTVVLRDNEPTARLQILKTVNPQQNGQQLSISNFPFTIGREQTDLIITGDPRISRIHATITFDDGVFHVMDMNSSNHIYIDGQRIQANQPFPLALNSVTKISLGPATHFTFQGTL